MLQLISDKFLSVCISYSSVIRSIVCCVRCLVPHLVSGFYLCLFGFKFVFWLIPPLGQLKCCFLSLIKCLFLDLVNLIHTLNVVFCLGLNVWFLTWLIQLLIRVFAIFGGCLDQFNPWFKSWLRYAYQVVVLSIG